MINVQENFKIDLRTYGRQFNIKLKVNNSDFNADNLNYIKPSFSTPLFKTIMHQIELDSKVFMSKDTKISGRIGVKVNEKNYKYIDLNNYYVQSCERQEDTNSYRVLAYSKMKEAMVDYDLNFAGKITVRNYLIKICERLGWNTDNIPATFINSEKIIDPNLHTGIKYSFRDALDEIATITCSFLMFKGDNFYLLYLTETNETIDESYLDEDNVTIGEKYFINSLVFSRAEESDNIYRKDNTSITVNGLHEYRIADCQLLSTNDRADYIDEMFNYLKTLEFYIFDVQSKGILFLEACDLFNFKLNNTTYKVALLNDEINIDDGLKENLFLEKPEETETEYKYADSTDKKINQTYILVDKQNQRITQLTEETTENSQKLTKTEQDVNGLTTKVSSVEQSVENITNTQNTATGKNIHLEDSSDDPLVSIKVKGSTTQSTRSGKNIFNKNAIIRTNGVTKSVLDTGVRITQTYAGQFMYGGIKLGGSELLGKTLRISANWTKSADNVPYIAVYFGNSSSMALYSLAGTGVSSQIKQTTLPNAFPTVGEQVCDTVFILLYSNRNGTGNVGDYVDYTDLIVTVDNDDMTYEDYGTSPSPDYPSEIENIEGRNILDISKYADTSLWEKTTNYFMFTPVLKEDMPKFKKILSGSMKLKGTAQNLVFGLTTEKVTPTKELRILNNGNLQNANYDLKNADNIYLTIGNGNMLSADKSEIGLIFNNYDIQLEEGTQPTSYVPYNSLEIKDVGENLFDCANSKIIYNNASTLYERLTNGLKIISSGLQYNMLYFLVDTVENLKGKTLTLSSDILFSKEKQYVDFGLYYTDFNSGNRKSFGIIESIKTEGYYTIKGIVEEGENRNYVCIGLRPNMDSNFAKGDYTIYDNLQVEIGETATPYTPYKEQKVTFPLSDGQKLMEGSYLASDGIHNKRKQVILDGSERWVVDKELTNTIRVYSNEFLTKGKSVNALCNYFETVSSAYTINTVDKEALMVINTTQIAVRINKTRAKTVSEFKAYLSEQYSNGTPVIVEYELAAEEIVPYTTEQQEAWNKIEQLHTYKNVTNIFSDTELDIVYVRDNGLSDMYETKQNASKNYTKTVEKFAEQKITTDEISSKVSSLETTTVKEIQVQYALGDNSVTAPETGWNTTAPKWQTGKYMWQKTVTVYANGTTVESSATCIQGAKGEDGGKGDTGATGKGIKSIQEQYYLSTSNTTQTGGSWKNTQDIWTAGKYIWTRSHITWSDNTTTDTTPILAQGLNTANKTANDTKENLENNYSTTVEMNSAITTKANEITTEVNKKVNELELGTKIEQNYEHVKVAWNKITEFIQMMILNGNASLAILDNSKKILMSLDKAGQHFYDSSENKIGDVGVINYKNTPMIAFNLNVSQNNNKRNGLGNRKKWNILSDFLYCRNIL